MSGRGWNGRDAARTSDGRFAPSPKGGVRPSLAATSPTRSLTPHRRRLHFAKAPRHSPTPRNTEDNLVPTAAATPSDAGLVEWLLATTEGQCVPPEITFTDLVNTNMQSMLSNSEARSTPSTLLTFVRECCKDLRSRNGYEVMVASANVPMHTTYALCADVPSGVEVHKVEKEDIRGACDIFARQNLFLDARDLKRNMQDMHVLTQAPYHCCVAKHGGKIVGSVVYSIHGTTDGHRMVYIELLASEMADVGTLLFRYMRALPGVKYFLAWCVKTPAANALYQRQLPQVNTPVARSLMLSLVCKDPLYKLRPDLLLRCDCVS